MFYVHAACGRRKLSALVKRVMRRLTSNERAMNENCMGNKARKKKCLQEKSTCIVEQPKIGTCRALLPMLLTSGSISRTGKGVAKENFLQVLCDEKLVKTSALRYVKRRETVQ